MLIADKSEAEADFGAALLMADPTLNGRRPADTTTQQDEAERNAEAIAQTLEEDQVINPEYHQDAVMLIGKTIYLA